MRRKITENDFPWPFTFVVTIPTFPTQEFVSRRTFSWSSNLGEATILGKRVKNQPFVDGAKRFYSRGNNNRVRQLRGWERWMWRLETSVIWALFGSVVACFIYTGSWDTVPYTKRRQFSLIRRAPLDDEAAEKFERMKKSLTGFILPPAPLYSDGVRVQTIARDMIEGSQRKEGDARIKKRWEAFVVKDPAHAIASSHCGKIDFFGGEDAEIAAFIAPTVGRVVANHDLEMNSMVALVSFVFVVILHVFITLKPFLLGFMRFPLGRSLLYCAVWIEVAQWIDKIYSLKTDLEADYIGLMLVASAGYDPRVALQVREKMGRSGSSWEKMRARRLVLHREEALSKYKEVWAACV